MQTRVVGRDARDRAIGHDEARVPADQAGHVLAPLLDRRRLRARPVDDRGRHRRDREQAGDHRDEVVLVDRVELVGALGMQRNRVAREDLLEVERGPAAVVAVRHVEARSSSAVATAARRCARRPRPRSWRCCTSGMIARWLSPNASVSRSRRCPAGSYTPVDEQCRNARALRHRAISRPAASAFAVRSRSKRPDFTTARLSTTSKSSGTAERSSRDVDLDAPDAGLLEPFARWIAKAGRAR